MKITKIISEKKSQLTNLIAVGLMLLGYYSHLESMLSMGLFAFSGAITNWLAIYMLFEKVPLLYGSGVIPSRFEEFKLGIKNIILKQFFTEENIYKFINSGVAVDLLDLNSLDFDKVFNELVEAIMQSSFGGMLMMAGGQQALEPLKQPLTEKLRTILTETTGEIDCSKFVKQIELIIDDRLIELTPNMVKNIIQDMIQKHLGWLVVWGGVFGAVIGGLKSLI